MGNRSKSLDAQPVKLCFTSQQGCPVRNMDHEWTVSWLGIVCILNTARLIALLGNEPVDQRSDL